MSAWLIWRLLKFGGLMLLASGMAAVFARPSRAARLGAAHTMVLPAFVCIWVSGYGLMHETSRSIEGWIGTAMVASLLSLHGVLLAAYREQPGRTAMLSVGALGFALGEMVLRPTEAQGHVAAAAVAVLCAAGAAALEPSADPLPHRDAALWWVRWTGRVEGGSLIVLLAISIGRRALGIDLGWWPQLFGWTHGVLVLVWFNVLLAGGRSLGWGAAPLAVGAVSAMVPLGPLLFERYGPGRS